MSEVKVNKISPRTNCGTVTVGDSGDSVSVTAGVPVTVNGDLKSNALKATDGGVILSQCGTANTIGAAGDTVTVAGNDIRSNDYKAADGGNIINQCGASITLGANNDFIKLGTGAGFSGGIGTVRWETTAQTGNLSATAGRGYFMNTTSGALTLTLPASPNAGDIVAVKDYANTFDTNNLTIARNGSNIGGAASDSVLSTEGTSITLVYVDATKGWLVVQEGAQSDAPQPTFIQATGGTTNDVGDYRYHAFTGPGTFCVSAVANPLGGPNNICFMVVGGGGGGQQASGGGAGGAGGFRTSTSSPISAQAYPVVIGAGGATGTTTGVAGANGSNSVFNSITSTGGGGGGAGWTGPANAPPSEQGQPGGSGGGGGARYVVGGGSGSAPGGNGNTPPVSPSQGNPGGNGSPGNNLTDMNAAGGGGAAASGGNGTPTTAGAGGAGSPVTAIFGPSQPFYLPGPDAGFYAGGGSGFRYPSGGLSPLPPIAGGIGGGGNGDSNSCGGGTGGTANSGGGAGGAPSGRSAGGGSGMVIIKYKFQ